MTEKQFNLTILPMHRRMYAVALHMLTDADAASDCVQDAFVKLWQHRARLAAIDSPEAYCLTVVKRACIDRLRRDAVRISCPADEERMAAAERTDATFEDRDALQRVASLIDSLPENQQTVIRLSALGGMSNADIARATGQTDGNVRTLLSRGRKRLRTLWNTL